MFTLTQELHDTIVAYDKFLEAFRVGNVQPEPVNPWPQILEEMAKAISSVEISSGHPEELCIEYIESYADDNSFYDHIRARYNVGAIDAQSIVEELKPFAGLRQYA